MTNIATFVTSASLDFVQIDISLTLQNQGVSPRSSRNVRGRGKQQAMRPSTQEPMLLPLSLETFQHFRPARERDLPTTLRLRCDGLSVEFGEKVSSGGGEIFLRVRLHEG
ncbi:MAG: hypothetical protein Q9159_004074 [Coniocarpon cinnabarinum]